MVVGTGIMQNPEIDKINRDELADIDDIVLDMEQSIPIKADQFMKQSKNNPFVHMNEGYLVIVKTTDELNATDAMIHYLKKRAELRY